MMVWAWHMKITYTNGNVRENDYSTEFGPADFALFLSKRPNVARVEITTAFVNGEQVSPYDLGFVAQISS